MKKIVLFYKRLVAPGGAERLLIKEFEHFTSFGYDTEIVCFEVTETDFFKNSIPKNKISALNGKSEFDNIKKLANHMKSRKDAVFLCNSGYPDVYIASLLAGFQYSTHIHQPSFMSFNEMDKYCFIHRKAFDELVHSNHGAERFIELKKKMSLKQKLKINVRSILSWFAVRKAKKVFVLSNYAVKEKKMMYGIDAVGVWGALEPSDIEYTPKHIEGYDQYKYRLISIARLDVNKRIDELIRAFSDFLKHEPNSVLLIGGKGDQYDFLVNLAGELGISENVKFLGFVPDDMLYDYYALADLFVSIDWADFRITSYEAMAMGTKVLLSDETDADKKLIDSGYFYLTKPTREETFKALKHALSNDNIVNREELKNLLKEYTWDSYFKKIIRELEPDAQLD